MELSEVVNPHFAFPVVGVVLCAFLVFAFGFKSSVQPPSFDNFEEEKKPRKPKTKKKAHIPEVVDSAVAQKVANHKAAAAVSKAPEKSPQVARENKSKVKRSPAPVSKKPQEEKKPDKVSNQIQEDEGWEMVSISKKKKNKSKKESEELDMKDRASSHPKVALRVYNEPVVGETQQDVLIDELEFPQPQRNKKAKGKSTNKTDSNNKENIPEVGKKNQVKPDEGVSDKKTKANTPIKEAAESPGTGDSRKKGKKSKLKETTNADMQIQETSDKGGEGVKAAAKKENKKEKTSEHPQQGEPAASSTEKKSKSKKSAPEKGASHQNEQEITISQSNVQSEAGKIQKNKKKKDSKQPVVADLEDSKVVAEEYDVEPTSKPSSAQAKNIPAAPEAATHTSDNNADTATNAISFDELGDWQDAKPTKKRKTKARRDN